MNILKEKKNIIICLSIIILLLVGVNFIKDLNRSKTTRTIMIYMVGSDLESETGLATSDLSELKFKNIKRNNTNIVLMAGGTTAWQNSYVDVSGTSIYSLNDNGFYKVLDRDIDNMGSSDNLLYFLNYVYDNYKTDKYDFIFWDHGAGVDGSEYDDFTNDHLMLTDMSNAFSNSPFKGDNKLEVLSFRTCLNGTLEMANIYKDYADYLVASEEIAYITNMVSALRFVNDLGPDDNGIEFGTKQINNYKKIIREMCEESTDEYCVDATYSIIDLAKITDINNSLDTYSLDLYNNLENNYSTYSKIRANIKQYASDIPEYDMVDLYDLSLKYDNYSTSGDILRKSIDDAVIYNFSSNDYSHGLSIYFPYNRSLYMNIYKDISTSVNYSNFINELYKVKGNTNINSYNNISNNAMVSDTFKNNTDISLELSKEQIDNMTQASYMVFVDTKDGYQEIIYQGDNIEKESNKISASINNKILKLSDYEYENDSSWLSLKLVKETDDYIELKAPVVLSKTNATFLNKNVIAYITIRIDSNHPNGYISNIYTNLESIDTDNIKFTYSPIGIKLNDYNFISVMSKRYKLLNDNLEFNSNYKDTSNNIIRGNIFKTDEIKLIRDSLDKDYDYYVVFKINDISNKEYYSRPIKLNK